MQSAHNASVPVDANLEIYPTTSRQGELQGLAKFHGHYRFTNGNDTSFYHYLVRHFSIAGHDDRGKQTAYKFRADVYNTFVPISVRSIYTALSQMSEPVFKKPESKGNGECAVGPSYVVQLFATVARAWRLLRQYARLSLCAYKADANGPYL